MKKVFTIAALMMVGQVHAVAGFVAVVADVNANFSSNFDFYDAVLGSSEDVLFSRSDGPQNDIRNHYNSLSGVTAVQNAATLTASLLAPVDLLVVTRSFNASLDYAAAEMSAVANFVNNGGSVLMITESADPNIDGYNNFLSSIGSTINYTGDRFLVDQSNIAAESTSLGALDPFQVSAYNTLSGGTATYVANNGVVVAFEEVGAVPEPASIVMWSMMGGIGFMARRRRKKV